MTKLQTVLAGTALAMVAQFAAAQTATTAPTATPIDTSNPAYTDQSRANQSNDPYVKKRVATKEARDEYKADKKAAKETYKEDKKAAKTEMKEAKKEAKDTRKAELADPAKR
jgi:ABC-type transporter lipoprotein component MlaA